jgi:poly(3-hydroxybutyrate) depolymerase
MGIPPRALQRGYKNAPLSIAPGSGAQGIRVMTDSMQLLFAIAALFALPADAAWERHADAGLSYWLYTPEAMGPRGLMLNLHGCGQHADDLKELGNWEATAEAKGLVIAIPDVPNGGVVLGCWDYYGRGHTESNRHNGPLLALTEQLLRDPVLAVDPERVWVSGLSSGATQALLLGCLRPDLFSGVAVAAGPALGSEMNEISSPRTTAEQAAAYCRQLAGTRSFARQKASFIHGDQDFVVNPQHTTINEEALAALYGTGETRAFDPRSLPGANPDGTGTLRLDASGAARISVLINRGLAHNWPSGKSRGNALRYVNPNSVDYPAYLGDFFALH